MIFFEMTEIGATPGILKKELNKILKGMWIDVGSFWHGEIRRKHFLPSGAREYSYRERTEGYKKRKMRKKGHRSPLRFSGESMRRTAVAKLTSTKTGVKVTMNAPALNFRPKGWPHTLREELLRVSPDDVAAILKVADTKFERAVKAIRKTKKTRIK